jgi:hypothetical protein
MQCDFRRALQSLRHRRHGPFPQIPQAESPEVTCMSSPVRNEKFDRCDFDHRYILAQVVGAYVACMIIYMQYKDLIVEVETGLQAKGLLDKIQFTPLGTGGILGLYMNPETRLLRVLLNEFVTVRLLKLTFR